jgi:hypothetical protein
MLGAYGKIATTLYFRMDLIDRDHPGRAWHSGAIDRSACTDRSVHKCKLNVCSVIVIDKV